jgi:hypothetical protein
MFSRMAELLQLIWSVLTGLFRSRASREAEIVALRHPLNVLHRQSSKRPTFSALDRLIFVILFRIASATLRRPRSAKFPRSSAHKPHLPTPPGSSDPGGARREKFASRPKHSDRVPDARAVAQRRMLTPALIGAATTPAATPAGLA